MENIKTFILMALLVLLFMYFGNLIGGQSGMTIALAAAVFMNFFSYFFSDKMVLSHYKATEVNANTQPELYAMVQKLAHTAGLPMPKVYIVPEDVPNAFATGRNPEHAAVAVTRGLLQTLSSQEIEGVLAHEMSHINHRDILISSVAAMFAGAIANIGNFARVGGTVQSNNRQRGGLSSLLGILLMPLAAAIIQMSISRTREYKADEGAAYLTEHPEWLMAALQKLENFAKNYRMNNASTQTAHMFIVNPFSGLSGLLQTHPSTKDRIARLAEISKTLRH